MITSDDMMNYYLQICDKKFHLNYRGWDFERIMNNGEFKEKDSVLDTGALHSYFSIFLSRFVNSVLAVDNFSWAERDYFKQPSTLLGGEMLPTIEEWKNYIETKGLGKIKAEKADLEKLQYNDNSFDKVLSISTVEHVINDRIAIREIKRVLKPNGLLLMTVAYNENKWSPYTSGSFMRVYNKAQLDELLKDFSIEYKEESPMQQNATWTTLFIKARKNG